MRMSVWPLFLPVIFTCQLASAAEDCSKRTNDPEVLICTQNNRTVAEKELNAEYSAAKMRIDDVFSSEPEVRKDYLAVFLDAQRNWLKYRDGQCKLYAHVADKNSNLYLVFTDSCVAELDAARTKELKEIPYD